MLKIFKRGLMIIMKKVNEIFSDYECDGNINIVVV